MLVDRLWQGVFAIAKLSAGLPLGGERVWPGAHTDLFLAHRSIYRFFAEHVTGKSVLDAGCGTGYGTVLLAQAGAHRTLGVDLDKASLRYARRKYARPGLSFELADLEQLNTTMPPFDVIVSSNALEHLRHPKRFLERAAQLLEPEGRMLLAVPPITNQKLYQDNLRNPHHLSNLWADEWIALFAGQGFHVTPYRHTHPRLTELNFSASRPTREREEDYKIEPVTRDSLYAEPTLTAIFELTHR